MGDGNRFNEWNPDPEDPDCNLEIDECETVAEHNQRRHKFHQTDYLHKDVKQVSERYVLDLQIGDISYIIQFRTVNFLAGLLTMLFWESPEYFYRGSLHAVYDQFQLCHVILTHKTRFHRWMEFLVPLISNHLPCVLAQITYTFPENARQ